MAILAGALVDQGLQPTLLAPKVDVKKFSGDADDVEVIDFDTGTSVSFLRSCSEDNWTTRLPSLDRFDIVVSDNLVEILQIRPDAILSGGFLWHDALDHMNPARVSTQKSLLEKFHPWMLTNALFAMPEIGARTRALTLPFFGPPNRSNSFRRDILIASGRSGEADEITLELIQILLRQGMPDHHRAHIEPSLLPDNAPKWLLPAAFDAQMYQDVAAALIRPGIGTITNALLAGCRIFPFYEPGNREMAFNAKRIQDLGLGQCSNSPESLFKCCTDFLTSESAQIVHGENVTTHVQGYGEVAAAKIIAHRLSEMSLA
jgi:hypothetical protein